MKSSISTKRHLFDTLQKYQDEIGRLGVQHLGVFGSFARGEQNPSSDIDFFVIFEKDKKTFDNYMDLADFLQQKCHRNIEIITPESISPHLKPYIISEVEYAI